MIFFLRCREVVSVYSSYWNCLNQFKPLSKTHFLVRWQFVCWVSFWSKPKKKNQKYMKNCPKLPSQASGHIGQGEERLCTAFSGLVLETVLPSSHSATFRQQLSKRTNRCHWVYMVCFFVLRCLKACAQSKMRCCYSGLYMAFSMSQKHWKVSFLFQILNHNPQIAACAIVPTAFQQQTKGCVNVKIKFVLLA